MTATTIRITGRSAQGVRVGAAMLRDLLDPLVDAVRGAVRLRADGRSRAAGPLPGWLERASRFDVELGEGSTTLSLLAEPLSTLVPERFAQGHLFDPLPGSHTCVDLFVEALDDALDGKLDSDRFDDALIDTLTGLGHVLDHEVELFAIDDGRARTIARESIEGLVALRRSIPADQRVRLAGKLDLLKHSSRLFSIAQPEGEVRGVITTEADFGRLGSLLGREVLVSGVAKFRPSGRVLRIETEDITLAQGDVTLWESAPRPLFGELDVRALKQPQGPRSGVGAIFGQWPGDDDEEVEDALRDMS